MTKQNENMAPTDSLQLINEMINQAKNRFSENGFLYLLWGWLILVCSVGHFVLLKLSLFKHPEIIWASCWVAIIFQVFYLIRRKKKETVKTYSENILGFVWMSFAVSVSIIFFIMAKKYHWDMINSLLLVLYGIPTFLSGVIMQFKSLKIGGIVCWCLAIISVFVPPVYILLLLAVAVIAAWIIPGYLLRKKYLQQDTSAIV